jgi:hypothetical protein
VPKLPRVRPDASKERMLEQRDGTRSVPATVRVIYEASRHAHPRISLPGPMGREKARGARGRSVTAQESRSSITVPTSQPGHVAPC